MTQNSPARPQAAAAPPKKGMPGGLKVALGCGGCFAIIFLGGLFIVLIGISSKSISTGRPTNQSIGAATQPTPEQVSKGSWGAWQESEADRIKGTSGPLRQGLDAYLHEDYGMALKTLGPFAAKGQPDALLYLGLMYRDGEGVKENHQEAAKLIRQAAESGNAQAQLQLGALYREGYGIKKDPQSALTWFMKAADQGDDGAAYQIGDMYDLGEGVPKSSQEAIRWFERAASHGDKLAKDRIALILAR